MSQNNKVYVGIYNPKKAGSCANTQGVLAEIENKDADAEIHHYKIGEGNSPFDGFADYDEAALEKLVEEGKEVVVVSADTYGAEISGKIKANPKLKNVKTVVASHTYEAPDYINNLAAMDVFVVPKSTIEPDVLMESHYQTEMIEAISQGKIQTTYLVPINQTPKSVEAKYQERIEKKNEPSFAKALESTAEKKTYIFAMFGGDLTGLDKETGQSVSKVLSATEIKAQAEFVKTQIVEAVNDGGEVYVSYTNSPRTGKKYLTENGLNCAKHWDQNPSNDAIIEGIGADKGIEHVKYSNALIGANVGQAYLADFKVMNDLADQGHKVVAFVEAYSVTMNGEFATLLNENVKVIGLDVKDAKTKAHEAALTQAFKDGYMDILTVDGEIKPAPTTGKRPKFNDARTIANYAMN